MRTGTSGKWEYKLIDCITVRLFIHVWVPTIYSSCWPCPAIDARSGKNMNIWLVIGDMTDREEKPDGIKATRTLFRIVETVRDLESVTTTDVANELDVATSTVHRHLKTLHDLGYVIREGNEYRLSLRFLDLGVRVRQRRAAYREMKATARDLADQTGELVSFVVEECGAGVFLYRERGDRGVESAAYVGKRVDLHTIAAGKALLAHLPDERIDEIVGRGDLSARTENTVTDRDEFMTELEQVMEDGLAFAIGEHTVGLDSVGAAVTTPDGDVIGGLSIAGPTHRMDEERFRDDLPQQLLSRINEFELNLTYA